MIGCVVFHMEELEKGSAQANWLKEVRSLVGGGRSGQRVPSVWFFQVQHFEMGTVMDEMRTESLKFSTYTISGVEGCFV